MRIRKDASLIEDFDPKEPSLPIEKPIVLYIRQSTGKQVKNNIQSKIQQDTMMEQRLLKYGWTHDLIIKIEADQGISGQKSRFEREGLDQLYRMIETGEAAAIACYDASRLWRDRTHVWYNMLIEDYLKKYHIPVVMWSHVYWMSKDADEEGLREEFKQAAFYLKHIYNKVNPAKLQAVQYGCRLAAVLFLWAISSKRNQGGNFLSSMSHMQKKFATCSNAIGSLAAIWPVLGEN